MIFDKENSLWKSNFDSFWQPVDEFTKYIDFIWIQLTEKKSENYTFFMILDPTLYIKMCWHMGVVTDWFIWWILVVKAESFTKFEPMMKIFRVWIGRRKLQRFSKVKLTTFFHEFESTNLNLRILCSQNFLCFAFLQGT